MYFHNSKKIILSLLICLNLICINNCKADNTQMVEQKVSNSLEKMLPKGSQWQIKSPSFLQQEVRTAKNIEVVFPNFSSSNNLIAQVWLNYGTEKELIAIPIKINRGIK